LREVRDEKKKKKKSWGGEKSLVYRERTTSSITRKAIDSTRVRKGGGEVSKSSKRGRRAKEVPGKARTIDGAAFTMHEKEKFVTD